LESIISLTLGVCGAFMLQLVCACLVAGTITPDRSEPTDQSSAGDKSAGRRWAVILVGIPGDDAHSASFPKTADAWQKWLIDSLQFPAGQVLRFPAVPTEKQGEKDPKSAPLTADTIRTTFADSSTKLGPDDTLWVFTLGHGNYDGKHAWFHVAGRDPSHEDFGRWLSEIRCREQVIWLTHANSGWFVKPLSKPGRIVIAAAAADDESNETEFPEALATVIARPLQTLDTDQDGRLSVAELFSAVVQEVANRFKSDKRLPTEHAQLDDDGDGKGSEDITPQTTTDDTDAAPSAQAAAGPRDGDLARKTFIPLK
jgi:hypothetical protein